MKQFSILLLSFLFIECTLAQSDIARIKTDAVILEIKKKRARKYMKEIARVSYTTKAGLELESQVELFGIPILGSFKKVGDKIEIYYDENNPGYIETGIGSMLTQYGMYVLIILGVFFSYRSIKAAYSTQNTNK